MITVTYTYRTIVDPCGCCSWGASEIEYFDPETGKTTYSSDSVDDVGTYFDAQEVSNYLGDPKGLLYTVDINNSDFC